MFVYVVIELLVGLIAGILLAVRTKKKDEVVYNKRDETGRITNRFLLVIYLLLSPVYLILGMLSYPRCEGFLGVIGWIITIINASTSFFCCLSLGASVYLRKQGKSKLSFVIQFVGLVAIVFTVASYGLFVGNLLQSIN